MSERGDSDVRKLRDRITRLTRDLVGTGRSIRAWKGFSYAQERAWGDRTGDVRRIGGPPKTWDAHRYDPRVDATWFYGVPAAFEGVCTSTPTTYSYLEWGDYERWVYVREIPALVRLRTIGYYRYTVAVYVVDFGGQQPPTAAVDALNAPRVEVTDCLDKICGHDIEEHLQRIVARANAEHDAIVDAEQMQEKLNSERQESERCSEREGRLKYANTILSKNLKGRKK